VERLDARSFFFHPQLIVFMFLALVLKVCRNRFRCHGPQCGRTIHGQAVQFWSVVTILNEAKFSEFQGFRASRFEACLNGGQTLQPCNSEAWQPGSIETLQP
jgi:hypothetical protein